MTKIKFKERDADLIFVEIVGADGLSEGGGTFYVVVKNDTKVRQVHSIGIKSNHAILFSCDGREFAKKSSEFFETKIKTLLPGEEKRVLVSWRDPSPDAKTIEIVAMFKTATSEPIYIA